jgi:hypothetical protein
MSAGDTLTAAAARTDLSPKACTLLRDQQQAEQRPRTAQHPQAVLRVYEAAKSSQPGPPGGRISAGNGRTRGPVQIRAVPRLAAEKSK